jgi:serine/threonine protein kinase
LSTSEHSTGDPAFEALLRDLARAPAVSLADLDLSGRTLGRFEVRRRIGAGGMGAVYEAWDTRLLRVVALKVLHAWKGSGHDAPARLVAEARRAAAVSHPAIAAVYDVDTVEGITFLAQEHIAGRSLDRLLAAGNLRVEEALRVARRIASALACAHRAGIVHRDLTPANVMIGLGGAVKLLDFGIATTSASSAGGPTGTPGYMAPEQIEGGVVDARADVFSFGVLLRALLAGKPRPGTEALVLDALRLARRCVARLPDDRPADGGAVALALRGLGRAQPARPSSAWIGAAVALGALAGLALLSPAAQRPMHPDARAASATRVERGQADALDAGAPTSAPPARLAAPRSPEPWAGDALGPLRSSSAPIAHPAPDDPFALLPAGAELREATAPAELPVTAYVDGEGRLVTVADLQGNDPRQMAALGGLILRAAPGGHAAGDEPELRHGTLEVSPGPRGTMRITLDLEPSGRTASLGSSSRLDTGDPTGGRAAPSNGARGLAPDLVGDAGSAMTKGVAMGTSTDGEDGARDWHADLCGVPFSPSLTLRFSEAGALEIVPSLDALGELRPPLAVIDPERGLLRAAPGVAACPRDDASTVEL